MAPKVYGIDFSPPVRGVLLTAKAIDLDIEYIQVDLFSREHMKPEFTKMNPQHTVPTLDDDGFYLWDSHAIATYLVSKYAKDDSLYPKDLKKRAIVDRLLHFDSGILFPRARGISFPIMFLNEKTIPEEKKAGIYEAFDFLESFFDGNSWIAGNQMTVADLCIIPVVSTLVCLIPIEESKYPKLLAWIEKCKGLPYFAECNNPGNDGLVAQLKELLSSKIYLKMAPKVYGTTLSFPVRAVLLTVKAIDLDIEFIKVNLLDGDHKKPEFTKMNPQHTVPTLDDDGFYLWDSHAIVTYLVSKYAKDDSLYPKDLKKRAIVDRLLHFDSGIIFPRSRSIFYPIFMCKEKTISEEKKKAIYEAYDFLESFLYANSWIAGNELTVADLCIIPAITSLEAFIPIQESKYPKLSAWIEQCKRLPYYAEWNKPGCDALIENVNELLSS
ncbi:uncharacterized protein LOC123297853 [Chrysoperla carnea]|uniref:uncharacterized protein LOC123297853 n=1 Tax=Chrysoperla carnea TaxID=189513 RepID=UPI001D0772E7|nr:uncharacterized protein LOC123297853 [Chrysoperla carnea]